MSRQVILSCSHVFHRACLRSFEKFSKNVVCPICRAQDYQCKIIDDGAKIYKQLSIIRIQSVVKGFLARKRFERMQDLNPPTDPLAKKRYYMKKLTRTSNKIIRNQEKKKDAIDVLFAELDNNLQLSRMAMSAAEIRGSLISDDQWSKAKIEWEARKETECPICISTMEKKKCVMLSCSHLFHSKCLASYEKFTVTNNSKAPACPICRSAYLKRSATLQPFCGVIFDA